MSTVREYCEKLSDEKLQEILRQDFNNEENYPVDLIMMICEILARRNPSGIDAQTAYRQFCQQYMPKTME